MNFFVALMVLISSTIAFSTTTHASDDTAADTDSNWQVSLVEGEINSPYHDSWVTVSGDGLSLYFGSNRPGGFVKSSLDAHWARGKDGPTNYDMYVARRDSIDDPWGKPILLPATVNSEYNDHSASVSADGHYLFFASARPGGCGAMDLYMSYRENIDDDQAWQPAQNLGCQTEGGPNGKGIDSCPILHTDSESGESKIYYTASETPSALGLDFKYSNFSMKTAKATGDHIINISTEYLDGHIDPHHGYVWGSYPYGLGGGDIWQSQRQENENWSAPVNIGSPVNSEYEEQIPAPTSDGKFLFFPSNRPGGKGGMDIYLARQKQ